MQRQLLVPLKSVIASIYNCSTIPFILPSLRSSRRLGVPRCSSSGYFVVTTSRLQNSRTLTTWKNLLSGRDHKLESRRAACTAAQNGALLHLCQLEACLPQPLKQNQVRESMSKQQPLPLYKSKHRTKSLEVRESPAKSQALLKVQESEISKHLTVLASITGSQILPAEETTARAEPASNTTMRRRHPE